MDPLRPFATLIRSLWTGGSRTAERRNSAATSSPGEASAGAALSDTSSPAPAPGIASRLQSRLAMPGEWNPGRAREVFVECALLAELGEDLSRDPGFGELVRHVSLHLGSEPRISARLDELLRGLTSRGE